MSSFNLGWIGENWFQKPQNPLPLFHFRSPKTTHFKQKQTSRPLNFACISVGSRVEKPRPPLEEESDSDDPEDVSSDEEDSGIRVVKPPPPPEDGFDWDEQVGSGIKKPPPPPEDGSDRYERMLKYYFWECKYLPDYRRSAKVEEILAQKKEFPRRKKIEDIEAIEEIEETEEPNLELEKRGETILESEKRGETILESEKRGETILESEKSESCTIKEFLLQAEAITDQINEMELADEKKPFRKEEEKLWKSLPHVTGPDGRPMPRKIIATEEESEAKFWDFARQFFFGLWGFRQRPYPPGRPCDVAQAIGFKRLEKRYYDCESLLHYNHCMHICFVRSPVS